MSGPFLAETQPRLHPFIPHSKLCLLVCVQVNIWRRSYDIPPPALDESSEHYPGNDERYKGVPKADLPYTESLKMTEAR